jgi:MFS family permease
MLALGTLPRLVDDAPENETLGRPFWTLLTSSGLSNLADGVFKVALPLVAIRYTRSPALVAGLELVRTLPWLLGSLQVGALTDRVDRRHSMLVANTARALFVTVPAVAIGLDHGSLVLLYLAAVGTGMAEVFYDTAGQSILPSLVPTTQLDRANGRLFAMELGAQEFAGPPLGGALVAIALALGFATSAVLWAAALVALLAVTGDFRPGRYGPAATIRSDIGQGLRFLMGRPILRTMALMVGVANLASSAAFAVIVLFAVGPRSPLGLTEPQFGLLFATMAGGAVVGGLAAERVQTRMGRARSLTLSVLGMIAYILTPALTTNLAIIAGVFFTGGLTVMIWNIITVSFRQRVTPDPMLGRVNSAYRLVAWGTRPLGAAIGGVLGEWLGLRAVFAVMGLLAATVLIPNRRITEESLAATEDG